MAVVAVLTPEQAADLAARTLAAINAHSDRRELDEFYAADRERVASDLAGLRECLASGHGWVGHVKRGHEEHARRYADSLRRTAALYGVQ